MARKDGGRFGEEQMRYNMPGREERVRRHGCVEERAVCGQGGKNHLVSAGYLGRLANR